MDRIYREEHRLKGIREIDGGINQACNVDEWHAKENDCHLPGWGECLLPVLDGQQYSPPVCTGVPLNGKAQITGRFIAGDENNQDRWDKRRSSSNDKGVEVSFSRSAPTNPGR